MMYDVSLKKEMKSNIFDPDPEKFSPTLGGLARGGAGGGGGGGGLSPFTLLHLPPPHSLTYSFIYCTRTSTTKVNLRDASEPKERKKKSEDGSRGV